jgi:hypothetical protein
MDLVASLTPRKQEIIVHLHTQLQNVCGIAWEELPVFSELLAEWNEHCQDSLRMSETQRTFSFSQRHLYYLDAVDHFIITTLAVMELAPLLGSRPGVTLTNAIEMNLATGPGATILGYFALGLHLQVLAEVAYHYASEGRLIRPKLPQESAWQIMVTSASVLNPQAPVKFSSSHRIPDLKIDILPLELLATATVS